MKRAFALFVLVSAAVSARAQSPEWTAILSVRPDPTPYIADWENDPLIVTLVLSYSGNSNVAFYLDGRIIRGATPIVGGRSTAFEFVRPSQLLLTTRDGIWDRNSVTYETALRDQIERTGRIPDGEYQFCVDVRQGTPEAGGGALLAQDCAAFSITAPQPPSLISPADNDSIAIPNPTFIWTPVSLGANAQVSYHVRIAVVLPGQSPLEALNNVPHYETDIATSVLRYPQDALPLDDSVKYVWQVQALDASGLPVGERQGKSEAWSFTSWRSALRTIAGADSTVAPADSEHAVGRFRWAGLDVKVLAVRDTSRNNFTGRGRVIVIPGVFEPSFTFQSLRMDSSRTRVAFAPRHVIGLPTGDNIFDYALKYLPPAAPFFLNLTELVLVADSGGPQYAGITGTASLFLGLGVVDSLTNAGAISVKKSKECPAFKEVVIDPGDPLGIDGPAVPATTEQVPQGTTICHLVNDVKAIASDKEARDALMRLYEELKNRSLYFSFDTLGIAGDGPHGTLRLLRDFPMGVYGLDRGKLTLAADSTMLRLHDGGGTLELAGTFLFPPGTGLIRDHPDTTWKDKDKKEVKSVDSTITLAFRHATLGTDGEVCLQSDGIPKARVAQTGIKIQSGKSILDLSGKQSPTGREPGWRGVYFDSVLVTLPDAWHTPGRTSTDAAGDAAIFGRRLVVDGNGVDGEIIGSRLANLGPVGFAGFEGRLDSVYFKFSHGTLDRGYVQGRLAVPFLVSEIPYWVDFTPVGINRAYAKLKDQERIGIPALGGDLLIQRGEFTYIRPVGTFSFDAKLTIEREGIALKDCQVYGLTISNDGGIKLKKAWITLDQATEADFKHFPVALDSIGFGSGTTGNEVWLGIAGRFSLNDNLPASAGSFRLFAKRDAPGSSWRFSHLTVDRLKINFENGGVAFRGEMDYLQNDPVYGSAFKAGVQMTVAQQLSVTSNFIVGSTDATASVSSFRYWYVDASLILPPPGIQLGQIPLSIYGFGGGAYVKMRQELDPITLKAKYIPDANTAFGLKALLTIGTSAQQGYVWNADVTLEARIGTSGGLEELSLRGDNWMITDVLHREKKIWGTVFVKLPTSQPVLHANIVANVNMKPALYGENMWAELHFEPSKWYVNVGTAQKPDSLILLPTPGLNLKTATFFQMDRDQVNAGFSVFLKQEKKKGIFYGKVEAGYELGAQIRYRPFQAAGQGELWGEIVAKVKAAGDWYEILSGTARATMNFRFPNPTGIWGRVKLKYSLAGGSIKGTYKMNYSWGDAPSDGESDESQFVIVAATSPVANDSLGPLTGMTYYLGMNEGTQYGMDDGTYRLRLSGTPFIYKQVVQTTRGVRTTAWQSIGTVVRDWQDDRGTLVLRPPSYGVLLPATRYRAVATFVLEKQSGSSWTALQTVNSNIEYRTINQPVAVAQLISETDPPGAASPLYYGGPNAGAIRVRFSNLVPEITGGAVGPRLVADNVDTVTGTWGPTTYGYAAVPRASDPTLYAFRPAAGALAPSRAYRFSIVSNDSTAREHYAMNFVTSRYATLLDHVNASTKSVTPTRGAGPQTGSGNYLLRAQVVLAGPEPITWTDIDSVEVTGLTGWTITTRTRCQWAGGSGPQIASLSVSRDKLCGATPTYENVLDVAFSAASDAQLPGATLASITIRMNHRREGWRVFTFAIPPAPPPPIVTTPVDITGVRR